MRVALCTSNFPPEFLGGTERVVAALARALLAGGDEVLVVTGSDVPHCGEDVQRSEQDGVTVARIARRRDEPYDLDVTRPRVRDLVVAELRRARIECVHVHHWAGLSSALLRGAREAGIPGIATLHDLWTTCPRFFRRAPAGLRCPSEASREGCVPCVRLDLGHLDAAATLAAIRARDAGLRAELAAARAITVPSATARRLIAAHLPFNGAIEVVPHGLLEAVGAHDPEPALDGVLRVGHFGNLVAEKGVLLLVEACAGIEGLSLRLAGRFLDPAFESQVRTRASALAVPLTIDGPYGPDRAHPARALDLAVFPSQCEETYGLVVEEALARGVPVVVSDRGALAERIGGAGVVVPVDEPGPLARVLRGIAADRSRLHALRAKLPRRFDTMHETADRYRALYRRARSGGPA